MLTYAPAAALCALTLLLIPTRSTIVLTIILCFVLIAAAVWVIESRLL
jgi:hypothetical protein